MGPIKTQRLQQCKPPLDCCAVRPEPAGLRRPAGHSNRPHGCGCDRRCLQRSFIAENLAMNLRSPALMSALGRALPKDDPCNKAWSSSSEKGHTWLDFVSRCRPVNPLVSCDAPGLLVMQRVWPNSNTRSIPLVIHLYVMRRPTLKFF